MDLEWSTAKGGSFGQRKIPQISKSGQQRDRGHLNEARFCPCAGTIERELSHRQKKRTHQTRTMQRCNSPRLVSLIIFNLRFGSGLVLSNGSTTTSTSWQPKQVSRSAETNQPRSRRSGPTQDGGAVGPHRLKQPTAERRTNKKMKNKTPHRDGWVGFQLWKGKAPEQGSPD